MDGWNTAYGGQRKGGMMCRNSRQLSRLLCALFFFAVASYSATAQDIKPEAATSLPNELAAIPSSELLTALRARILEVSARVSSISGQLTTLEAMYLEQTKELGTSYAYSTSLSAEKIRLESELAELEDDYVKAVRARDLWRSGALISAGAAAGALIGGPVGAAIGAGVGALAAVFMGR